MDILDATDKDAPGPPPDGPAPDAPKPEGAPPPARTSRWRSPRDADELSWGELLKELYFSFDRRTLALTRFVLGAFLLFDLFHRGRDWLEMYSNAGILPGHVMLWRPQSDGFTFFTAFGAPGELWALWLVGFTAFACLFVGFKTKVAQVVSLLFVASMNGRVLLVENGGYVVQNLLLLWTCFLPLGDRYSVDALRDSMRRVREATEGDLNDRAGLLDPRRTSPHVTLMGLVLVLQIAAIYFFNVIHKTGPQWRDGTAVHYVLYVDRRVTPLIAYLRDYPPRWLIYAMTKGTVLIESGIALAVLNPLYRDWSRRVVVVLMNTLHLIFAVTFTLGPFVWSACAFSSLMFGPRDWELAEQTMRRPHRGRTVLYDRGSPAAFFACRLLRRLDRLDLLTFEAGGGRGLAAFDPSTGQTATGALALADLLAALPGGPLLAWLPRLGAVRSLLDALFTRFEGVSLSHVFGVRPPGSVPPVPPPSPLARGLRHGRTGLREALVLVMFAAAVNQAAVELWVIKRFGFKQGPVMTTLAHRLRLLQGWFMFCPVPEMEDGTIVVDAETVDGRHVDPFSGKAPDWDLENAKSLRLNQAWGDYFSRIHSNATYHEAMREYLMRYAERTGKPGDAIVSGEVWWISDVNPAPGKTRSTNFQKLKLFKFDKGGVHATPADRQQ